MKVGPEDMYFNWKLANLSIVKKKNEGNEKIEYFKSCFHWCRWHNLKHSSTFMYYFRSIWRSFAWNLFQSNMGFQSVVLIMTKRWRWELLLEFLWSKTLSASSFGRYWKQLIKLGSQYFCCNERSVRWRHSENFPIEKRK